MSFRIFNQINGGLNDRSGLSTTVFSQVAIFRSYFHNNIIPIVSVHIVAINEMISMQCKPNVNNVCKFRVIQAK